MTHPGAPPACRNMMLSGQIPVLRMTEVGIGGHSPLIKHNTLPVADRLLRGVCPGAGQIAAPDTVST